MNPKGDEENGNKENDESNDELVSESDDNDEWKSLFFSSSLF